MLQQTQVERVVPRYDRWLERWPTVELLAAASPADVIREWQGLGYNRRALSLHRAAVSVAEHGWPADLTTLPGVGPYTAAAVRNFAFGEDLVPRDVNVERVERRTGHRFSGCDGAGADGPRRDRLPRPDPAVHGLPARGSLPVVRHSRRARAEAVAVRGVVPAATSSGAPPGRRAAAAARATWRSTRLRRWRAMGSSSSGTAWSSSRVTPRPTRLDRRHLPSS